MDEELDPFDFSLAKHLGMTLSTLHATMGNDEYLAWRAYFVWRAAMDELDRKDMK